MSPRRARRKAEPDTPPAIVAKARWLSPRLEIDLIATLVLLLVAVLAWASRGNLNVDGVAYLDLADRLRAGDWSGFVQGYWSPAYPALLAVVLQLAGASGPGATILAHLLNCFVAMAAVLLLWRLCCHRDDPALARLLFAAFLLASARTPRLDAVTPDLLLLTMLIGVSGELLRDGGWRPLVLGGWFGAAFLAKTSTWPWLLVTTVVLAILDRRPGRGRRTAWLVGATAVLAATWIVPMSREAGHPTLGVSGRLNACWYLESCDGRSPDSHRGGHRAYTPVLAEGTVVGQVARFGGPWTYEPWSDPGAWQEGLTSQREERPGVVALLRYWATQFALMIGLWSSHLLLAVVVPLGFATRPRRRFREVLGEGPGLAMVLGTLGMLQFVAVHVEPRLVAPFLFLLVAGVVAWRLDGERRRGFAVVTWLGLVTAVPRGLMHLPEQFRVTSDSEARVSRLLSSRRAGEAKVRVAVIGEALPLMPDLYRARATVVAQVFTPPAADLLRYPAGVQQAVAAQLQLMGATEAWISRGTDGYSIASLLRAPEASPPPSP